MGTRPGARPLPLLLLLPLALAWGPRTPEPGFEERRFAQTLDHFSFESYGNRTFPQRYLSTGTQAAIPRVIPLNDWLCCTTAS